MNPPKENLDRYQSAYQPDYRFNDENMMMLSFYAERMCNTLREKKAKSVLSLGIGHRIVSQSIMNEFVNDINRYLIVEGSPDIISDYQKRYTNLPKGVEIKQSYFEDFKTDERFDAIEMGFVLEHVTDPLLVIQVFTKLLKPGGTFFIAVPNARSMHRQLGNLAGLLPDMYKLSEEDHQLGHKHYFDMNSFKKLVTDSGLTINRIEGNFLKPFMTSQMNVLNLKPEIWRALMLFGVDYPDFAYSIYIEATI